MEQKEICYVMLGKSKLRFTHGKLVRKTIGKTASVGFDWSWVLKREEQKGDVIGFWHTHPNGNLKPSERDRKTMGAWIDCFGKSLLCIIQNTSHETAYLVSPVQHKKWKYAWVQRIFVYKIFRRFGVYS